MSLVNKHYGGLSEEEAAHAHNFADEILREAEFSTTFLQHIGVVDLRDKCRFH